MSLTDNCTSYGKVLLNKQLFLTSSECFCTETEFSEKPKEFEFCLRKTRASKGYFMRVGSIYEPLKIFSVDSHEMFVTERFENSAIKFYIMMNFPNFYILLHRCSSPCFMQACYANFSLSFTFFAFISSLSFPYFCRSNFCTTAGRQGSFPDVIAEIWSKTLMLYHLCTIFNRTNRKLN